MPLVFEEETHRYFLDGKEVPSVSALLEPLNKSVYSDIPSDILQAAAERGTAVHRATEDIDAGISFDFCEEWFGYIEAYMDFKKEHEVKWFATEQMYASKKHKFAGTVDRVGMIDDNFSILDIKTTSTIHKTLVIPQLTLYEMLYDEEVGVDKVEKRYILQLQKKGKYKLQEFEQNAKLAKALLEIYKFKEKNK